MSQAAFYPFAILLSAEMAAGKQINRSTTSHMESQVTPDSDTDRRRNRVLKSLKRYQNCAVVSFTNLQIACDLADIVQVPEDLHQFYSRILSDGQWSHLIENFLKRLSTKASSKAFEKCV